MIKFIKEPDTVQPFTNNKDSVRIEYTIEDNELILSELLEHFEYFLKANGYVFEGCLGIVNEAD